MQRKFLAVATIALVLLFTTAFHLTASQVALAQQAAVDPVAADADPAPLPQPMRINFRQTIPLTISITGATPLTASTDLTAEAASALMGTLLNNIAASTTADATAELTATETGDGAAEPVVAAETAELAAQAPLTPTTVAAATEFAVLLTVEFDLVVTDTLTTTVPALVTVQVAENLSSTIVLSATVAPQPDGELVVELIPVATPEIEPTATGVVTETSAVTPTVAVTPDATPVVTPTEIAPIPTQIGDLAVIATTTVVTANFRSGPGTNFDQVAQVGPQTPVGLVAISEDGQWYLLSNGAWVAGFLVTDQPTTLPIATQAIIDQVTAAAAAPAPSAEATPATTPDVAATPTPAAAPVTPPTVTTNANVRSGPGTEFPVIGGTTTGQAINIVGRNADGTWFLLDFGAEARGWVSAELVANPPALETVPVFNADGTAVAPTPAPAPGGGLTLPTPTPVAPAPAAGAATNTVTDTTAAVAADPATTEYLSSVTQLINAYDTALVALDALIAEARTTPARLTDTAWITRLTGAVTQLRQANASVGELAPPTAVVAVQENLVAAARQYTLAADALEEASSTGVVTWLDKADESIQSANASLTDAEAAIRQAGQ